MNNNIKIGSKARISQGSGVDSDKIVTIVDKSKLKIDGRGIPTNVSGAYKPIDWSKEDAIQYADGSYGVMFKNRLIQVNANEKSRIDRIKLLRNYEEPGSIFGDVNEAKSKIRNQVKEIHSFAKKCLMAEKLILKRKDDKIYTVSDDADEKKKPFKDWETVRNKAKLKSAGFSFDGTAWWLSTSKLRQAQEIIAQINNSPLEKLIDNIEELPEFVDASENFDKKAELSAKIEGFVNILSGEVDAAKSSEAFKAYMNFSSKFYKYSFNNIVLIYLQRREATHVGSFNFWKKMNRHVKKGARGIWIFSPITVKDDGDGSNTPGLDDAVKKTKVVGFRPTTVFDIADTEASNEKGNIPADLKWHGNDEPEEKADKLVEYGIQLADQLGIKVDREKARGREKGHASGDNINVVSGTAGAGAFGTLIHEIAHSLMHFKESSPFYTQRDKIASPQEKELEAETVSYVVLKHYGLPAQHHSVYLANWKANKEGFQNSMKIITKVSAFLINSLDKIANKPNEPAPTT